ncbi:MAG: PAS domain-containing protein [Bacteroidia bacterium]
MGTDNIEQQHTKNRIEELERELQEYKDIVEAIRNGSVDALAISKDGVSDIYKLESIDYVYRLLVENSLEGALNINDEGLIVYANKAFESILASVPNKIIGHSLESFLDPKSKPEYKRLFKSAFSGNSKGEVSLLIGNTKVPVSLSLTSLYPKFKGIGIIVSDLTDKRRSEQEIISYKNFAKQLEIKVKERTIELESIAVKLEEKNDALEHTQLFLTQLINSSEEVIIALDTELKYMIVNRRFEELMNLKREEVLGKSVFDISPKIRGAVELSYLQMALAGEVVHMESKRSLSVEKLQMDTYYIPLILGNKVSGVIIMGREAAGITSNLDLVR